MRLAPCTLTLIVALQLHGSAAAADEPLRGASENRDNGIPTTLRAVHLRDLASREEPAAEPPGRERWLDRVDATKGGLRYQETLMFGERKVKVGIKGPFLRSQEPGMTFEVKF
jgi:hypothetical protein